MIKISFLGDLSLNDHYRTLAQKKYNPFEGIRSYLDNKFVVANLEATAEGNNGYNELKKTRLATDIQTLKYLNKLNIKLVALANNHIFDNRLDGFLKTINFLETAGIVYTGCQKKENNITNNKTISFGDTKIGFLSYVHLNTNPSIPENSPIKINYYNLTKICQDIKDLKNSTNYVILMLHWGIDNSHYPSPIQRKHAKIFVEAGADIIIGHHSHVLQGVEKISKSLVFYSLGNFCFSPLIYSNLNHELDLSRQIESIILDINIKDNLTYNYQPIKQVNYNIIPIKSNLFKKLTRRIPFISNPIIWPLYRFYLNFIYKIYFYFLGNKRNPFDQLKKIDSQKLIRLKKLIMPDHNKKKKH